MVRKKLSMSIIPDDVVDGDSFVIRVRYGSTTLLFFGAFLLLGGILTNTILQGFDRFYFGLIYSGISLFIFYDWNV